LRVRADDLLPGAYFHVVFSLPADTACTGPRRKTFIGHSPQLTTRTGVKRAAR